MATTKRKKGGRAAAPRAKASGHVHAGKKSAPKKPAARASAAKGRKAKAARVKVATPPGAARPKAAAAPKAGARPKRAPAAPKRPPVTPAPKARAAKAPAAESQEVVALRSKFQRERSGLEKRLTEAVREIGMLRHHEIRATQLERRLAERDAAILQLQQRLAVGQRGAAEPVVYAHEVQQSFALVIPASEGGGAQDAGGERRTVAIDEFGEQQLVDDADLVSDDDLDLATDD
ncbi:MAG: hypothetical protein IT294_02970 [Deltaproteobacteria bacterium]|nr:hypothetical protein [Deltaproteobacteria bacterium]